MGVSFDISAPLQLQSPKRDQSNNQEVSWNWGQLKIYWRAESWCCPLHGTFYSCGETTLQDEDNEWHCDHWQPAQQLRRVCVIIWNTQHSSILSLTADAKVCPSVCHCLTLKPYQSCSSSSDESGEQSSAQGQKRTREEEASGSEEDSGERKDFAAFLNSFPVTLNASVPTKKQRLDAGFSSDRVFYDKWRSQQRALRSEYIVCKCKYLISDNLNLYFLEALFMFCSVVLLPGFICSLIRMFAVFVCCIFNVELY